MGKKKKEKKFLLKKETFSSVRINILKKKIYSYLYNNKILSDYTISFADSEETIKAHKLILSNGSDCTPNY
jgi:hypothetical protein